MVESNDLLSELFSLQSNFTGVGSSSRLFIYIGMVTLVIGVWLTLPEGPIINFVLL